MVTLTVTFFYAKYSRDSFLNELSNGSVASGEVLSDLPDVSFKTLEGEVVDLLASKEKFLVIHFWATWCAPCEAEFPEFLKLAKKYTKNFKFYLVAVNDDIAKVKRYIKRYDSYISQDNIIVLADNASDYYNKFGTAKVPETYVFNAHTSKLVRKYTGPQDWGRATYQSFLNSLL